MSTSSAAISHDAVTLALAQKESAEHLMGMDEIAKEYRSKSLTVQAFPLEQEIPPNHEDAATTRIIKTIHLIRHGQGFHNLLADRATAAGIEWKQFAADSPANPYMAPEVTDAPLTDKGRRQAIVLRDTQVKELVVKPQLVVLSPLCRALQTGLLAMADFVGTIPFVAHELVREQTGIHLCDKRRSCDLQTLEFPMMDFSLLTSNDDATFQADHRETHSEVAQRAYQFLEWLVEQPQEHVVIASHSAWLLTLMNAVVDTDAPALKAWFQTGEMRSCQFVFTNRQQ